MHAKSFALLAHPFHFTIARIHAHIGSLTRTRARMRSFYAFIFSTVEIFYIHIYRVIYAN